MVGDLPVPHGVEQDEVVVYGSIAGGDGVDSDIERKPGRNMDRRLTNVGLVPSITGRFAYETVVVQKSHCLRRRLSSANPH